MLFLKSWCCGEPTYIGSIVGFRNGVVVCMETRLVKGLITLTKREFLISDSWVVLTPPC